MTLPIPTQRTWTVGDISTAAFMNSNVRDAVNYLANPPLFIGYGATGTTVGNNQWWTLGIDTNVIDTYSGHSTTSNNYSYVAPVAGTYEVLVSVVFANNATGRRGAGIAVGTISGPTPTYAQYIALPGASNTFYVACKQMVPVTAGQAINALCYQDSTGILATTAGQCTFQVRWVHA